MIIADTNTAMVSVSVAITDTVVDTGTSVVSGTIVVAVTVDVDWRYVEQNALALAVWVLEYDPIRTTSLMKGEMGKAYGFLRPRSTLSALQTRLRMSARFEFLPASCCSLPARSTTLPRTFSWASSSPRSTEGVPGRTPFTAASTGLAMAGPTASKTAARENEAFIWEEVQVTER